MRARITTVTLALALAGALQTGADNFQYLNRGGGFRYLRSGSLIALRAAAQTPLMTYAEMLSQDPSTPVGTQVQVSDGFVVSGSVAEADNTFYAPGPAEFGKDSFEAKPIQNQVNNAGHTRFVFSPDGLGAGQDCWSFYSDAQGDFVAQSAQSSADNPWQADWSGSGLTLTHPATLQLNAPGRGALLVSGGSPSGTVLITGTANGKNLYTKGTGDFDGDFQIKWEDRGDGNRWYYIDLFNGPVVYYSLSDTPTPLTATGWKNASDDSPASITIALTDPQAGVAVLGGTQDGVYPIVEGLASGRVQFGLLGHVGGDDAGLAFTTGGSKGNAWYLLSGDGEILYYSLSNVATPDLAGTDKIVMERDGVIYTKRGVENDKPYYTQLGEEDSLASNCIVWATGRWRVYGGSHLQIDNTTEDTATPDLCGLFTTQVNNVAWLNAADDTWANTLVVSSVSQSELDAGVTVAGAGTTTSNGPSLAQGDQNGRRLYLRVSDATTSFNWGTRWDLNDNTFGDVTYQSPDIVAFPWSGTFAVQEGTTPAPTVTRNDVAAPENWKPVATP